MEFHTEAELRRMSGEELHQILLMCMEEKRKYYRIERPHPGVEREVLDLTTVTDYSLKKLNRYRDLVEQILDEATEEGGEGR